MKKLGKKRGCDSSKKRKWGADGSFGAGGMNRSVNGAGAANRPSSLAPWIGIHPRPHPIPIWIPMFGDPKEANFPSPLTK